MSCYGLAVGLIVLGRPQARRPSESPTSSTARPQAVPPPSKAFIYRLPSDGYETARMAVASAGAAPVEMGIFSNEAAALAVARSKGWALAWTGVRELPGRPQ